MARRRLVIVEDDSLLRSTLTDSLTLHGWDCVGVTPDASSGWQVIRATTPDAVLLDLDLGVGPSGRDLAHMVRREFPDMGIVVMSGYAHPGLLSASTSDLPAGTVFRTKKQMRDTLDVIEVLELSISGARGIAADVVDVGLTDQQMDVLRRIARGQSNSQIAADRGVSEKAVEHLVSRIAARLHIDRESGENVRAGLVRKYYELTGAPLQR